MIKVVNYIKKPLVVEAVQYERNEDLRDYISFCPLIKSNGRSKPSLGDKALSHGDFIIKADNGDFYISRQDMFYITYDVL